VNVTNIYLASYHENEDGRGPPRVVGAFKSENEACWAVAEHKGYAATPVMVRLYENIDEFRKADAHDKKTRALAKLTREEQQLLGLA
jgi:hypothetical protein